MRVLIIEDEAPAARRLQQLLLNYDNSININAVLESISGTVNWLSKNPMPDLIFLDIQLADGISFDLFKQVEIKTPVIFTTAYDQYALQAFKVNSIDYLLKPIEAQALQESMHKYSEFKEQFTGAEADSLQSILHLLQQGQKVYKSRFLVKLGDSLLFIFVQHYCLFYGGRKLVYIITIENKKYNTDYSLDELENVLSPADFFRINRQFITHIHSVKQIHHYFNGKLKLMINPSPAQDVIVSRERAPQVKKWFDQ